LSSGCGGRLILSATMNRLAVMIPSRAHWPIFCAWLVLSLCFIALASRSVSQTGLDYDEAVYGHLAKDFLRGQSCPQHMPGSESVEIAGRPFPLFVQGYLGALKCWMLIPSFALCGESIAVMRWTMIGAGLIGLLCLMLWVRRVSCFVTAVLSGVLVAFDPAFFFPTVCEWGAFVPSFICRCAGLLFLTLWWQKRQVVWMILAGVALGLGFFNKIDFVVVLAAIGIAAIVSWPRELLERGRQSWKQCSLGVLAFVLSSAPMIWNSLRWLKSIIAMQDGERSGEAETKFNIVKAALDGSYFYRLMETDGLFHRMFEVPPTLKNFFLITFGIALLVLVVFAIRKRQERWSRFLLVGFLISVIGFFLMPEALRIHHFLLIYPFPQLIVAGAAVGLWRQTKSIGKAVAVIMVGGVMLTHISNVWRTQEFIATTGGRGQWSRALVEFAESMRNRDDVMLVSLDWGFHEQLSFLTDKPKRFEPTWNLQAGQPVNLLPDPRCYYLIHPPEFSLFPYGAHYLQQAQQSGLPLEIVSFTNREAAVVFQYFRFKGAQ